MIFLNIKISNKNVTKSSKYAVLTIIYWYFYLLDLHHLGIGADFKCKFNYLQIRFKKKKNQF